MKVIFEKQQLLICGAALALLGGFVFFGYMPLQERLLQVRQVKSDNELLISSALEHKNQFSALKVELEELKDTIFNYDSNIPRKRELGVFLQQIAELINKYELGEQVVQPGVETVSGDLRCIPIKIQCKGSLPRIFDFYSSLQRLDRMVRIENVKLVNNKDYSGQVSMQTTAVIYYKPEGGKG